MTLTEDCLVTQATELLTNALKAMRDNDQYFGNDRRAQMLIDLALQTANDTPLLTYLSARSRILGCEGTRWQNARTLQADRAQHALERMCNCLNDLTVFDT